MMMRGGPGGGGSLMGLLRSEAVQKEIELLDEQKTELEKFGEQLRSRRTGNQGGERPDFRSMSEEERQKFFAEMRTRMEERAKEANAKIEKTLLPHQIKRLKQIALQLRGVGALANREVAEALGLTDEQKKEIEEVQAANRETMMTRARELFQGGGERPDREKMREQFQKLREEADGKLLAVLKPKQMKKFEELKGEPFEMPRPPIGPQRERPLAIVPGTNDNGG